MIDAEKCMLRAFVNKRVLIFAPHEDDEINIAGTLLSQFKRIDVECRVVFSTNGERYIDPKRRQKEAIAALRLYGLRRSDIFFLGLPDVDGTSDNRILLNKEDYIRRVQKEIEDFFPNYIITNDEDSHPNHKELSILVDKAVRRAMEDTMTYKPVVLKTYAYSMAYFAADDYSSYNLRSTLRPLEINNPAYIWENRIRLPVPADTRTKILQFNSVYRALWKHHSQSAYKAASRVANADKVYWNPCIIEGKNTEDEESLHNIWFMKITINDEFVYDYYSNEKNVFPEVVLYDFKGNVITPNYTDVNWYLDDRNVERDNIKFTGKRHRLSAEYTVKNKDVIRDEVRIIVYKGNRKLINNLWAIFGKLVETFLICLDWGINERFIITNKLRMLMKK